MANYFTLTLKGETKPMNLAKVDEFICDKLNEPVDPEDWCHNWYNTLGFSIAIGHSLAQMRHVWSYDKSLIKIINILEEHFTTDAWAQR